MKIQKTDCAKLFSFLCILIVAISCSRHSSPSTTPATTPAFTDYASFVSNYSKKADPLAEMYGQYSAQQADKKIRAKFNLLVDPGERAYIEILDPSDRLLHVLCISQKKISLLWAKDNVYIEEAANPENLRAVIGLPINADDALQLIAGQGLQFNAWQQAEAFEDGWKLVRGSSSARIVAKENLSRIETSTSQGKFFTYYEKYEFLSEKSVPTRIRFEIPERKMTLELRINKYLPRTEAATADLFEMKLPEKAKKLALNEIYHGKPLLLE